MNTGGESAELLMKMMLNGSEVLIKLTGSGAKNVAVLLYSVLREQNKTKGSERLSNMLRSGKKLRVYTFQEKDLQKFKEVAKQYGILYTVLKDKDHTGGVFDVLVRAEDEHKLARVIERFGFAHVDTASLRAEILREKQARETEKKEEGKGEVKQEASQEEQKVEPISEQEKADAPEAPSQNQIGDGAAPQKPEGEFHFKDLDSDEFYVPESEKTTPSKDAGEPTSGSTKEDQTADDLMAGAKKREEAKANPLEARSDESMSHSAESKESGQEEVSRDISQSSDPQAQTDREFLSEPSSETPKEKSESHHNYRPKRKLSVRKQIEQMRRERARLAQDALKLPTQQKIQTPKVR